MVTATTEITMIDLFDGRHDCYFDSYKLALEWCEERVWRSFFYEHGDGWTDIGVYPRRDDGTCRWGCIDIDTGDFSEALAAQAACRDAGVDAWIEASGSWKDLTKRGYHVWVFASGWVEATHMRGLLVEVARGAGLPEKTEINPKQITATSKGVGNCVRLPYGRRSVEHPGYSCMVVSPGVELKDFSRDQFLAEVEPTPVDVVARLGEASIHRQSMRRSAHRAVEMLERHETWVPPYGLSSPQRGGTNQRAWRILHGLERASEGERNICAFVMACHLRGLGRSEDQAVAEMTVAVKRGFDGGDEFVAEAQETVRGVFRRTS